MKRFLLKAALIAVSLACIGLLITTMGCGNGFRLATLELNFDSSLSAKNIVPDESMDIALIEVDGIGPDSQSFSVSSAGENVVLEELLPGNWTITATGKNDVGTVIATGSAAPELIIGVITPVTITLTEDIGTGTLDVTFTWEPDVINDPIFDGLIQPANGDPDVDISADLQANIGTLTTTHVDTYDRGWYAMVFQIFDDIVLSGGYATAVRIAEGLTSTGFTHLYVDEASGSFELDFEYDMYEEIALTVNRPEGDSYLCGDTVYTFTADGGVGVYAWYLNGALVSATASYDVDASVYEIGDFFNLDVLFFSADASGGGSAHWNVQKAESSNDLEVHMMIPAGGGVIGALVKDSFDVVAPSNPTAFSVEGLNIIIVLDIPDGLYKVRADHAGDIEWFLTGTDTEPLAGEAWLEVPFAQGTIVDFGTIFPN